MFSPHACVQWSCTHARVSDYDNEGITAQIKTNCLVAAWFKKARLVPFTIALTLSTSQTLQHPVLTKQSVEPKTRGLRTLMCLVYTSARSPLDSSHWRRSPARFFARSMSKTLFVSSSASSTSCTKRRVSGYMVVSRSCDGFISPKPLKR